jgi:HEPN domain-containing protein
MAQQPAERAVKDLHQQAGREVWGHSVTALLQGLGEVPAAILDAGKALDKQYIPARW